MLNPWSHTPIVPTASTQDVIFRREFRTGDDEAIAELHDRVYRAEYGVDERFREGVARGLGQAMGRGWPERSGAAWLIDGPGELLGSLGLTAEEDGEGRVRWFVLVPELRGRGLGRALIAELVAEARAIGMSRLALETFSALAAAARIYRDAGFRVAWEHTTDQWGPEIVYQGYELELERRTL
jgi:GNAT superfamily N-acetyltransferase